MDNLQKRTWAQINLSNLEHNYRSMRLQLPDGCRFLGVVKANAYGHGSVPVARRLEALGSEYLAVACFDEAVELRKAGITKPLMIFGYTPPNLADELLRYDVTQTVSSVEMAYELSRRLKGSPGRLKVHIKLETGMGRLGINARDEQSLDRLAQELRSQRLYPEGVFTHFAVSDEPDKDFTGIQFARFMKAAETLEEICGFRFEIKHCANSGAVINYPETYLDMVRPGIALYGCYPAAEHGKLDLRPVMQLKTRIAMITRYEPGDTISYGRTFTVERPMRVAVLPVGYADGLHRALSNKMEALIRGKRARQIGRVCMDMCMVDVTGIERCKPGDIATIFGHDGGAFLPVEEHAEKIGTISYELLCAVAPRVPRVYTGRNGAAE